MSETKKDIWAELRKPFDKKVVGKLPKGGIQLDYVGHAAVTDRLNTVDPTWTWEPMAKDIEGIPVITETKDGFGKDLKGLWIRLTINGVTRPAFGDGKTEKECIGDALRNGAMRFGVALDLWTKDELESNIEHPENKNKPIKTIDPPAYEEPVVDEVKITKQHITDLVGFAKSKGAKTKDEALLWVNTAARSDDFTQLPDSTYTQIRSKLLMTKKEELNAA